GIGSGHFPRVPAFDHGPAMTRILGIDPGSQRTGVGIIDVDEAGRATHVFHAPLVLLGEGGFAQRLKRLLDGLRTVIEEYRPDEAAVEQVFMARNPDSALKLGQARGAALCAVVMHDLPVHEYAAREIKLALVGKGGAEIGSASRRGGGVGEPKGKG